MEKIILYTCFIIAVISVSINPSMSLSTPLKQQHKRYLPKNRNKPIIIGYSSNAKSGKAERAIKKDGANIIIWSFFHLYDDDDGTKKIKTSLDLNEIRNIRDKYENEIHHLAAFGGWNGPHPPESLSGKEWFNVFHQFNKENGYVFDGIDWDYEGHDNLQSPTAQFTLHTLDVMVDFSIEAKKHGYIVSMAPAESYLDASAEPNSIDSSFSLDLGLPPRAWASDRYNASDEDLLLIKEKGFQHAGRQCYAYILAKAGIDTFDFISIQLYEAYSPFAHDIRTLDQTEALMIRIRRLIEGYTVTDLPMKPSDYEVKIPPNKLVIGIANDWVDGVKFCKVEASAVRSAYELTKTEYGQGFLGVMFWTLEEEGETEETRLAHLLNAEFSKQLEHSSEL